MRYLVTAAAAALMSAGAAQAAVVDLTYTVEATLAGYNLIDPFPYEFNPPYSGPEVGDTTTKIIYFTVDTESPSGEVQGIGANYGGPSNLHMGYLENFDPSTGAGYLDTIYLDLVTKYDFFADGTARVSERRPLPSYGQEVFLSWDATWTVEGLPEVAPVPLPASGLLLLAGIGGLAAFRRRASGHPY